MGLFDKEPGDEILAVRKLVDNAESETVTKKALTKTSSGLFGRSLHNKSILTYLHEDEQPHYILHNDGKGLSINDRGEKEKIKPSDQYKAYAVLTDERVLFLVGHEDDNHVTDVSRNKLEQVQISTGVLKHRLVMKTNYINFKFYINVRIDSEEVEKAKRFLTTGSGIPESNRISTPTSTVNSMKADRQDRAVQAHSSANDSQKRDTITRRLREIDPHDFEYFVADLWHAQGWTTEVTQASGDQGIDVIATKESPFPQKQVIQAKRNSADNTVGGPKIQQYASLRDQVDGADVTVVVTTSSFSKPARNLGEQLNVKLIDIDGIHDLLEKTERFDLIDEYAPSEIQSGRIDANGDASATTNSTGELEPSPAINKQNESSSGWLQEELTYGSCPSCDHPNSYRHIFRKDLTIPLAIKCTKCETEFHIDENETLQDIDEYLDNQYEESSQRWYYGILGGIGLSIIGLVSMNLLVFLVAWILLPLSMSRDIQYIRRESERRPATAYWVWSAILIPPIAALFLVPLGVSLHIIVGGTYLLHRYQTDTETTNLHTERLRSRIKQIIKH
jgi:restriction endonuclease Mrr/RNA polymerase-binding transcription factor DksA